MRLVTIWLVGILTFSCLFAAYAAESDAAPAFEVKPLARVIRTERRFPIDFDACKDQLFGSGSSQGDLHDSWACDFGRMYWVQPYSLETWGIRRSYAVDKTLIAPGCTVSLDFASNGFGIFIELGHIGSKAEAAACVDLATHAPGSKFVSPAVQVFDTFEGVPLPGPDAPQDPALYEDHLIGEVASELEFTYRPAFADFQSHMEFKSKTTSACKPGIGCVAVSEGKSTFSLSGGPEADDFGFGADGFYTPDGPGCQEVISYDSASHEVTWTESFIAFSRLMPPLPPSKGRILSCAKDAGLTPRLRVFRYDSPYKPLPRP